MMSGISQDIGRQLNPELPKHSLADTSKYH
jgi:hypothetical protein